MTVHYLVDRFQTTSACGRHVPEGMQRLAGTGEPAKVTCVECRERWVDMMLRGTLPPHKT